MPFGHLGRGIVRAAGAEIGNAGGDVRGLGQHAAAPRFSCATRAASSSFGRARSSRSPMQIAISLGSSAPFTREQPVAVLVLLADAGRLVGGAVQLLAHLHLDQRALLLDDDDQLEALRRMPAGRAGSSGQGQRDLVEPQAEIVGAHLVDAELVERLAHVEIALADRDDADLRIAAARGDDAVEPVGADEGEHGVALVVVQPRLLPRMVSPSRMFEPARRHGEIVRHDDLHAVERAVDDGGRSRPCPCTHFSAIQAPEKRDIAKP